MAIDIMAIGAHPDDVDMICGGTIAKMAARGYTVVMVDLTRGEMGTRGNPDLRAEEARCAAACLGARERIGLDLGDGRLADTEENRRTIIELVRAHRPRLVMTHYWEDLHPDHAVAGQLLRAIMYPVGFANYPAEGEPFRPNEVLFFMGHTPFPPSFIADIDGFHEKKMEAIACFRSQFHQEGSAEPPTGISQPDFLMKLEARARYFGSQIGRTFGEPFRTTRPVPVDDVVTHYAPFTKLYSSARWNAQA